MAAAEAIVGPLTKSPHGTKGDDSLLLERCQALCHQNIWQKMFAMDKPSVRDFLYCTWIASLLLTVAVAGMMFRQSLIDSRRMEFKKAYPFDWGIAKVHIPEEQLPIIGGEPRKVEMWKDGSGVYLVNTVRGLFAVHDRVSGPYCSLRWQMERRQFLCPIDGSLYAEDGRYVSGPRDRSLLLHVLEALDHEGSVLAEWREPDEQGLKLPVHSAGLLVGYRSNGALPGRLGK